MCRLDEADVALSQVMSQMSGPNMPTLADDLIQTPRMTIEDLIESTEVFIHSIRVHSYLLCKHILLSSFDRVYVLQKCVGSVLVRTCELETHLGWYYQACTKCASKVTTAAGSLYCDKCKMPRTAIPRQVQIV